MTFAWARDAVGAGELQLDLPDGATVAEVMRRLSEDHPRLAERSGALTVAVNQEFVGSEYAVQEGDEVALIPPISGGGYV